ncbi:winged helix-turn-helix transcriptional regulator [Taibaiella soli]|uniref:Transcriptional regulator n=1 Tax=Taibaiella soli TaxID=1649169 RepID=A0A2W2ABC4_9BACT|nr:helix-turn-helix domain-containing protein [Taibaiella soli]PZF72715.1 transcriptional regulator [Taibaiella soli]
MNKKERTENSAECIKGMQAINDTMQLLSGKWKFKIVGALMKHGKLRFMDLLREVDGIAAKMLSKELHELEINLLVSRTIMNTKPVTVEYELTKHGQTLERVINEIEAWGLAHRKLIIQPMKK